MECPKCGRESRVLDSRPEPNQVRRRRKCRSCDERFTTVERLAVAPKQRKPVAKPKPKPKPKKAKPRLRKQYDPWDDIDHLTDDELENLITGGGYD